MAFKKKQSGMDMLKGVAQQMGNPQLAKKRKAKKRHAAKPFGGNPMIGADLGGMGAKAGAVTGFGNGGPFEGDWAYKNSFKKGARKPKPKGRGIVKALGQKKTTGNFAKIAKAKGKGAAIGALQNKLAKRKGKAAPYRASKKATKSRNGAAGAKAAC